MSKKKPPAEPIPPEVEAAADAVLDAVFDYVPPPKSDAAKKRAALAEKLKQEREKEKA